MGEDVSLDEFVGGSDDQDDADSASETEIAPAATTYAWTGEGAACGEGQKAVQRRWQQDGALVCSACKVWDRE